MTNEEAIEELKTRYLTMSQCLDKEELHKANKAIDMAIQALEQDPGYNSVNPELDLISRQAAIGIIQNWLNFDTGYSWGEKNVMKCVINELGDLPSATTENTGHWKRISMDKYSEHSKYWYRCDRCGKDNLGNTDWCPNCGCRMELWNENI